MIDDMNEETLDYISDMIAGSLELMDPDGTCIEIAKEYAKDNGIDVNDQSQLEKLSSSVNEKLKEYIDMIDDNTGNEEKLKEIVPIHNHLLDVLKGLMELSVMEEE